MRRLLSDASQQFWTWDGMLVRSPALEGAANFIKVAPIIF